MTETKAPYTTTSPTWTVAQSTDDWPALIETCTVFVLPLAVEKSYVIDDSGILYSHGDPDEEAFRALWQHLVTLEKSLPRAFGNALNYAETAFREPCHHCETGTCPTCNGARTDVASTPCADCLGSGCCPTCQGQGFVQSNLLDELIELSGRRRNTLQQYKSVYHPLTGVPPQNQHPDVKYSYDRSLKQLPVDEQPAMVARVVNGDFENSDQCAAEVKRIIHLLPQEKFDAPLPIPCPICGDTQTGWKAEKTEWVECGHCHAHSGEALVRLNALHVGLRDFFSAGEIDALQAYATKYHILQ